MSTCPKTFATRDLKFSVMFFACTEQVLGNSGYRLIIESARFADREGFAAVWVPERHFTDFGFLYPNPSVLHAALARETSQIRLRAGSVVPALHHPLRIAEEWAMVDNLSGGRVDISFASGWNPNDFAFFPDRYAKRHDYVFDAVETIKRLWRQETLDVVNGAGDPVALRVCPRPVQRELPVWITAAGNPETFARAGRIGANILTHLLDHGIDAIAERIALYRDARAAAGHDPDAGEVTVMLHSFVGADSDEVRRLVRGPFCKWLSSNAGLLKALAVNRGQQLDLDALTQEDREAFASLLFDRFFGSRALMGTPESCLDLVGKLQGIGVTEIACLLDFGPAEDLVLDHLPYLKQLMELYHDRGEISAAISTNIEASFVPQAANTVSQDMRGGTPEDIQTRCVEVSVTEFYDRMEHFGVRLESRFRGVVRLWQGQGEALGLVRAPEEIEAVDGAGSVHPAFLDACFQVFAAALPESVTALDDTMYLPVGFESLTLDADPRGDIWSHALLAPTRADDVLEGDVSLRLADGTEIGRVSGLRLQQTRKVGAEDPSSWLYEIDWVDTTLADATAPAGGARWLLLADEFGLGEALASVLRETGDEVVIVHAGGADGPSPDGRMSVDPISPDNLGRLLETAFEGANRIGGIVHLWSCDTTGGDTCDVPGDDFTACVDSVFVLAQVLARYVGPSEMADQPRLWIVTAGAQSIATAPRDVHPGQTAVWGFGRSFAIEHAELWGGLVDLDPQDDAETGAKHLALRLGAGNEEGQICLREGRWLAPRLVRRSEDLQSDISFRNDCAYCVTGGFGGIGSKVARWLVANGARHVILIGRREPPPRETWEETDPHTSIKLIRDLEAAGAQVTYGAVDIAEEERVVAFFEELDSRVPPIRGVFHAAGVGRGDTLLNTDFDLLADVLRPKMHGTQVLGRVLRDQPLDYFVMFSSATHQLGALGQGTVAYGAASAFLDGYAHALRQAGRPGLAIDWGPWSEIGMAAETGNVSRLKQFGVGPVTPSLGMKILGHALQSGVAQLWAIAVNWDQLLKADSGLASNSFLTEIVTAEAREDNELAEASAALRAELTALRPHDRTRRLAQHVQQQIVEVMQLDGPDEIDWRRGLFEIGIDSLMALELKNRLQSGLGVPVPSTLAFDHPTVDAIAAFLAKSMGGAEPAAAPDNAGEPKKVDPEVRAAAESIRALDDKEMERLLERKLEGR